MESTLARTALGLTLLLGTCACAAPQIEYRDNPIPIPVAREAPTFGEMPEVGGEPFVHAGSPGAAICLTGQGLIDLFAVLGELRARDRAWRAWALEPE